MRGDSAVWFIYVISRGEHTGITTCKTIQHNTMFTTNHSMDVALVF